MLNLVVRSSDALVISLDGKWGEGKTTFVKMWQGLLSESDIPNLYIDAFSNDYVDDAFISVASAITDYAERNIIKGQREKVAELKEKSKKVGGQLLSWSARIGVKAATLGIIKDADIEDLKGIKVDLSKAASDFVGEFVEERIAAHSKDAELIKSFRELLSDLPSKLQSEGNKPLVVIIDELDRCKPTFAVEVVEKIKHLFSVENVVFVLVMNKAQLEESIKSVYGQNIDAHTYLQKFVNIEAKLPKRTNERHTNDLGIPTMKDRAMQALYALALTPIAESLADTNSYGFREKRSVADAIAQCFICLAKKASPQWILEADIKACFDQIDHQWLLRHIPIDRRMLQQWLKSGYLENNLFRQTEKGTPQGGIISPVIANMTLDRLEAAILSAVARRGACVNVIRYADDFIITGANPQILTEQVRPVVETFLTARGLQLSEEKTHLCHIKDGFDFLGFNIRKYDQKLLIKPSKAKVNSFMERLRDYIKSNGSVQADRFLRGLNSRLRGFANFYRHVVSKRTFNEIDRRVYHLLRNWMHRRHRNKTHAWCKKKYIKRWGNRWQFTVSTSNVRVPIRLFKVADLPIIRHIKIKGNAHPYNPLYAEYFEQRQNRNWLRRMTDSKFLAIPAIERMV